MKKQESGQSFTELILLMPIFVMFFVAIIFFTKIYITKIILEQASRHGMFMLTSHKYNEDDVKNEIINYLTTERFLISDIRRENIEIKIINTLEFKPSEVTIKYKLKVPKLLARIRGFPNPFHITGHSECYIRTGLLQ
jgi:hypothetical protein